MRSKIRQQRQLSIPWLLIVGDRDIEARTVSVRLRTDEDLGAMPLDEFAEAAGDRIASYSQDIRF